MSTIAEVMWYVYEICKFMVTLTKVMSSERTRIDVVGYVVRLHSEFVVICRDGLVDQMSCHPVTLATRYGVCVICVWIFNNEHLGVGISEGWFIFDFASLPLEVARPI